MLNFNTNGLGKVLDALKQNIMKHTHVARIGIVKQIEENGTAYIQLLPQEKDEKDNLTLCYNASPFTLNLNDTVVVIFADKDFRHNLKQIQQQLSLTKESESILHSLDYGIIISSMNSQPLDANTYPVDWDATYSNNVLHQVLTMNNGDKLTSDVEIDFGSNDYNLLINKPTFWGYEVKNDILTPQIQTNEPDVSKYPEWYKTEENAQLDLLALHKNDIIISDNNPTELYEIYKDDTLLSN